MSLQDSHQIGNVRIMLVKGTDGAEIVSVEKTGTTGLVDTYTITLSNDQKYTFTVTNGKSIVSVEKTATVGLVDTYTITYNDGSTDTFEVVNGGYDVGDQNTATGNPLSFTTDSAQVSQNTVITFEPIQSGSGDPSPSNVRALSGFDDINILTVKKNLAKKELTNYTINSSGVLASYADSAVYIAPIAQGETYTCSQSGIVAYGFFTSKPQAGSQAYNNQRIVASSGSSVTFTAPISGYIAYAVTSSYTTVQIEKGETATTYEPYNPITDITLELDSTIYGGTLDVESGELKVTQARVDMGDLNWAVYQTQYFRATTSLTPHKKTGRTNLISDMFRTDDGTSPMPDNTIWGSTSDSDYFFLKATSYADATALISAVTGHYIVYELATPLTYQLNPHQVKLLQGANVVTSNGTSISLKWREGQVMTLDDANGLAESIEALGEQGTKVKKVDFALSQISDLFTFVRTLTKEQMMSARLFLSNGIWLYPTISANYISGQESTGAIYFESIPTLYYSKTNDVVTQKIQTAYEVSTANSYPIFRRIDFSDPTDSVQQYITTVSYELYYNE